MRSSFRAWTVEEREMEKEINKKIVQKKILTPPIKRDERNFSHVSLCFSKEKLAKDSNVRYRGRKYNKKFKNKYLPMHFSFLLKQEDFCVIALIKIYVFY